MMDSYYRYNELLRKSIHIIFGFLFLTLIVIYGTKTSFVIIGTLLILGVLVGLIIKQGIYIPLVTKFLPVVERDYEKHFPGKAAILFFLSAELILYFFGSTPTIVLAALSVEVFADAAAALVGKAFGKHKVHSSFLKPFLDKDKSLEGMLACFAVAFVCILFFFNWQIALIGAAVAMIAEAIPLNDNLIVPLVTALTLFGLS